MTNISKFLIGLVLISVIGMSCSQQADYKVQRDKVIELHDEVMADQGRIVANQMKLDTMLNSLSKLKVSHPKVDTLVEKDSIRLLIDRLTKSEERMNQWMHEFEPDITGKSNEEAIKYFLNEQLKIKEVDRSYKEELKLSDAYLSKFQDEKS